MRNRISHLLALIIVLGFSPTLFAQSHEAPKPQASTASESAKNSTAEKGSTAEKKEEPTANSESATETKPAADSKVTKILPSDVRVLIDISGSMKQTDPKNLRKPALDLLVRLLPDKSRAGVWTFGNAVNMLMPLKPVDAAWRKQAAAKSNEINSIAMYTNIGKALDEVSFDKKSMSSNGKKCNDGKLKLKLSDFRNFFVDLRCHYFAH